MLQTTSPVEKSTTQPTAPIQLALTVGMAPLRATLGHEPKKAPPLYRVSLELGSQALHLPNRDLRIGSTESDNMRISTFVKDLFPHPFGLRTIQRVRRGSGGCNFSRTLPFSPTPGFGQRPNLLTASPSIKGENTPCYWGYPFGLIQAGIPGNRCEA